MYTPWIKFLSKRLLQSLGSQIIAQTVQVCGILLISICEMDIIFPSMYHQIIDKIIIQYNDDGRRAYYQNFV